LNNQDTKEQSFVGLVAWWLKPKTAAVLVDSFYWRESRPVSCAELPAVASAFLVI
jgi:hypothetical protein